MSRCFKSRQRKRGRRSPAPRSPSLVVGMAMAVLASSTSLVAATSPAPASAGLSQAASLPAVVRSSTQWLLRDSLTSGDPTASFSYGTRPLVPLMGDWDGNGSRTPATFEAGVFKLRNANSAGPPDTTFLHGDPRGFALSGDWDGDGIDDVGVYRDGLWQIRFANGSTTSFRFGSGSWPMTVPVSGDWDGDGIDGVGVFDLATATWSLRHTATAGSPDLAPFGFGTGNAGSAYPVVGDWDGNGTDTVGVKSGATWSLRHTNTPGPPDLTFNYGTANDLPLSWRPPTPPKAMPDTYATEQATKLTVPAPGVLQNDLSPGAAPLAAVLVDGPSHGNLALAADGSFVYTPGAVFVGDDNFTYRAEIPGEAASKSTKVTITVTPVATTTTTSTTVPPPDPSLAPDTSITAAPPPSTTANVATFGFTATAPHATFECRLDNGPFASCVPPQTLTGIAAGVHTFSVRARGADGATDATPATFSWTVVVTPPVLPDLSKLAPPNDLTTATNMAESTAFLYTGPNAPQVGVAPGLIEPVRLAIVRGRVLDRDRNPLGGVRVSILDRPEFGHTFTRADGWFDLALNGGGRAVIDYRLAGYIRVQRDLKTEWDEIHVLDDVVLTPYDPAVTVIEPAAPQLQVAAGSPVQDEDGRRQAVLMFQPGTTDEMVNPDGTRTPLGSMSVRATELTVGPTGPQAMPGELPARSAYTYAVELSVDEAEAAGATSVTFNRPVSVYTDNFAGAGVGEVVPVGVFDRTISEWVAVRDGLVVGILAETPDGLAVLDLAGRGVAATPEEYEQIGVTPDERRALAARYDPGHSLWRVQLAHFSPCDMNWVVWLEDGYIEPEPKVAPEEVAEPETRCGSIIECENQALAETFPIAGTPLSLRYQSRFQEGRQASHRRLVQVSDEREYPRPDGPPGPTMRRVRARVKVAGRLLERNWEYRPGLAWDFEWDGLDAYGRRVQGPVEYTLEVGYSYATTRVRTGARGAGGVLLNTFGTSGAVLSQLRVRNTFEMVVAKEFRGVLGAFDARQSSAGLGGFNLDIHHTYAPDGRSLYQGNGKHRGVDDLKSMTPVFGSASGTRPDSGAVFTADGTLYFTHSGFVYRLRPGANAERFSGHRGGPAGDGGHVKDAHLSDPQGLAIGPDGHLYIAGGRTIRRVELTTETIYTDSVFPDTAWDVTFGPDGSMYVLRGHYRIDRRDPGGSWTHVAGAWRGFGGDGGPATEAGFNTTGRMAVDAQGNIFVADSENHRVRRIDTLGIVTTVAGGRFRGGCGEGGPAVFACLSTPLNIALAPSGDLYIAEPQGDYRLLRLGQDGILHHVAGRTGTSSASGDPAPLPAGSVPSLVAIAAETVAIAPDGGIFVGYTCGHPVSCAFGLARIAPAFEGYRAQDVVVPSEDGSELHRFTASGRHLATTETLTGAVLYSFTYDAQGRLASVIDVDGLVTTIDRSSPGRIVIRAPRGQTTTLTLGPDGYVSSLADPTAATHRFTWDRGLLRTMTTPRNHTYQFDWDRLGRLVEERAPDGLRYMLSRSESPGARGTTVSLTTGEGRTTRYGFEALANDGRRRTVHFPDGTTTTSVTDRNGLTVSTLPTGETIREVRGPDSRFGPRTSVPLSVTVELPGGLTTTTKSSRSATLRNPDNPLSLEKLTETTTTNGRTSTLVYDAATRRLTDTSAGGRVRTTTLDAKGRVVDDQLGNLAQTRYTYDSEGRLTRIAQGTGSDERINRITYDPLGHVESVTDPLERVVRFTHDAAGRVTSQALPGGRVVEFGYDAGGNPTSVTPPGRPAHRFGYTEAGLGSTYTPPDVGQGPTTVTNAYDADRQVRRIDLPTGQTVDLSYDAAGRLDRVGLGRGPIGYSYRSDGQLSGITAPGGIGLTYGYQGALPTRETSTGPVPGEIGVTYDADLRPATRTVAGHTASLGYDADSLLTRAGEFSLTRSADTGLPAEAAIGSIRERWSYNAFGEATNYRVARDAETLYELTLDRDRLGRITTKTETAAGTTTTWAYGYDPAGRLAEVTRDGAPFSSYTYDLNGNRLTATTPAGTTSATYDDLDRLLTYGNTSYSYNAIGQLTTKTEGSAVTRYEYDEIGNLIAVALPDGQIIEYLIDGRHRRVGKKVDGVLVQGFIWEDQLRIAAETDGNGEVVSHFVYGDDTPVPEYVIQGGTTYRMITDHVGSARLIVNANTAQVLQHKEPDAWGNILADTNPGLIPFGFAGGIEDAVIGSIRFGARDYDPKAGRWLSADPVRFSGSDANLYTYVGADPINNIDPSGLAVGALPFVAGLIAFYAIEMHVWMLKGSIERVFGCDDRITKTSHLIIDCGLLFGPSPFGKFKHMTPFLKRAVRWGNTAAKGLGAIPCIAGLAGAYRGIRDQFRKRYQDVVQQWNAVEAWLRNGGNPMYLFI